MCGLTASANARSHIQLSFIRAVSGSMVRACESEPARYGMNTDSGTRPKYAISAWAAATREGAVECGAVGWRVVSW